MSAEIAWGIALIVSAAIIDLVLFRFRVIRSNPVLIAAVLINPGLVGLLGGAAFLAKAYAPQYSATLLYCTLGAIAVSLPIVVTFVPKAILEQMQAVPQEAVPPGEEFASPEEEEKERLGQK